jgi:ankyrin repeat protein
MSHDLSFAATATIRDDPSPEIIAKLVHEEEGELAPGVPALCVAANYASASAVEALLAAGVDVNATYRRDPFRGWQALHFACISVDEASARTTTALLAAGADAEARTDDGLLPIDIAGTAAVVKALMTHGSPPRTTQDAWEKSQAAVFLRMMSAIAALKPTLAAEALLESGRPRELMRWVDASGRTGLHLAAFAGSPRLVAFCLDFGADVHARDLVGATPLKETLASYLPAPPVARLLLENGAKPGLEDVQLAVKCGLPSIVAMLLAAGAPAPPGVPKSLASKAHAYGATDAPLGNIFEHQAFLFESLVYGNVRALDAALRTGVHDLRYAMAACACVGTLDQMKLLLASGANANARVDMSASALHGGTPMHAAAACGLEARGDFIELLHQAGGDVNAELLCGLRPLDVARSHAVRQLLRSLGGVSAPREVSESAAAVAFRAVMDSVEALRQGDHEGFKHAVALGVHPSQPDLSRETAMHHLAQAKNAPSGLLMWLVQSGADVNARSYDQATPLHRAVAAGNGGAKLVDLLMTLGADARACDWLGFCPARLAAYTHQYECARAVTEFIAFRRRSDAEAVAKDRRPPARRRATKEQPVLTQEEFARRSAAAEAAAAALIEEEAQKKAAAARKAARKVARSERRARAGPTEDSQAATTDAYHPPDAQEDTPPSDDVPRAPPDDDEAGELIEPAWLAELLAEYDVKASGARVFVEQRVRAAPALASQLAAQQRCVVCLDGHRGAMLQPCNHAVFCRACCTQLVQTEGPRCPVCCGAVTSWTHVFV